MHNIIYSGKIGIQEFHKRLLTSAIFKLNCFSLLIAFLILTCKSRQNQNQLIKNQAFYFCISILPRYALARACVHTHAYMNLSRKIAGGILTEFPI